MNLLCKYIAACLMMVCCLDVFGRGGRDCKSCKTCPTCPVEERVVVDRRGPRTYRERKQDRRQVVVREEMSQDEDDMPEELQMRFEEEEY